MHVYVLPQAVKAACGSSFTWQAKEKEEQLLEEQRKKKWIVMAKRADFAAIAAHFHIDPVTARLLRNRDLTTVEEIEMYLHGDLSSLHDARKMKDMEKAAALLEQKIREKQKIRIMGDYDCDGIMSTCILLKGLAGLGALADYRIPDRIKDGYGLNDTMIQHAKEDGIDTILTCDNGISAEKEVRLAKDLGMTVIVTDHHEVPKREEDGSDSLPPADAVVNPHRQDCAYPFQGLCGAGIAYKLMTVLYGRMGKTGSEALLPYAAVATITDVMDLVEENRILVKEGLRMLPGLDNPGLLALFEKNGIDISEVSAYHIGFIIGPCLNASGRLYTASLALKLLLTKDKEEAQRIAGELVELNASRKAMTEQGVREAKVMIETGNLKRDKVLVVYLPDCHESIAGIIAGRIREAYYRPVYVLTDAENGVKGSGRSIEEYDMYANLARCADLLDRFGGHKMAAGVSLAPEKIDEFRKRLNADCALTEEDLIEKVRIDVPMPISYVTPELIEEFSLLEPFGKGNTKPVFAEKNVRVLSYRIVGANRNVMKLKLRTADQYMADGVFFGNADAFAQWLSGREEISILYSPRLNTFRGVTSLEIRIDGYC